MWTVEPDFPAGSGWALHEDGKVKAYVYRTGGQQLADRLVRLLNTGPAVDAAASLLNSGVELEIGEQT